MKYLFKVDNHVWACVAVPLNGFGSISLTLICGQMLFANDARAGVIAGVAVIYTSME